MKKKIFVVHHHKNFSGAARSMGELILSLKNQIDFYVICPKGSSSNYFKKFIVIESNIFKPNNDAAVPTFKGLLLYIAISK